MEHFFTSILYLVSWEIGPPWFTFLPVLHKAPLKQSLRSGFLCNVFVEIVLSGEEEAHNRTRQGKKLVRDVVSGEV